MARCLIVVLALALSIGDVMAGEPDRRFPLFQYLTGEPAATMVTYTPSQLDPRQEVNQRRLATSSIRTDLEALRPAFDGLVLYGYHEACTPRIVALAKELKYRSVLLAIWDTKSATEVDGVAELARLYESDFALGVLVGNEGITFKRYEAEDLTIAAARLRQKLPKSVPIGTSEPLVGYQHDFIRNFGDFLAPNIHPVFDRQNLLADAAATWAREEALKLARETKKPVLLKETGFPHDGRPAYSPATQQAYWSAYTKPGRVARVADTQNAWTFHGVAFEAFDLPWKSEESKLTIEKSWGLMSPKREPYPAFDVWHELAGKTK